MTGSTEPDAIGAPTACSEQAYSSYERVVLAKKPLAYWRLGEVTGGVIFDKSGNGHHGISVGAPVFQQPGAIQADPDTAVAMDGNRSYIEVPNHIDFSQPTSRQGLTVEAWLRPDALAFPGETNEPYVHWLGKGERHRQEWALRFYSSTAKWSNRISAYLFNPEGCLGAGAFFQDKLVPGQWIHIVACFDPGDADSPGAGVRLYKNGQLRREPPSKGTLYNEPGWRIKPAHRDAPLRLGSQDLNSFFCGGLDEVALYPRVLSRIEIQENARAAGRDVRP